jgi:hypothetical protein
MGGGVHPIAYESAERICAAPACRERAFEYFAAPAVTSDAALQPPPAGAFRVDLRRSGRSFAVPPDRSILEVLQANGVQVPFLVWRGAVRHLQDSCAKVRLNTMAVYPYPPAMQFI